jgi:hypothetical protein
MIPMITIIIATIDIYCTFWILLLLVNGIKYLVDVPQINKLMDTLMIIILFCQIMVYLLFILIKLANNIQTIKMQIDPKINFHIIIFKIVFVYIMYNNFI